MALLPVAAYWAVALWGISSRRREPLLYLFFVMLPFGALAIVPPGMVGGLTLLGAPMTALLLIAKEFALRPDGSRRLVALASGSQPARLLIAFWSVAALVTVFAPRLLEGHVVIMPMSGSRSGPAPLEPTTQNFSQLAYLTISVLAVFAFASIFRAAEDRHHLIRGLLVAGALTVVTGVLDYLSTMLPLGPFLQIFRTAQYALLVDVSLNDGTKRVVGLMPEASAFGALSIGLFTLIYFLRNAVEQQAQRRMVNRLLIALGAMIFLSTSSAGYVAVGVVAVLILIDWLGRAAGQTKLALVRRGLQRELAAGICVLAVIVALLIVWPSAYDPILERVNDRVVGKVDSDSFEERSLWTKTSLEAAKSSYLLGVGLGSTRASNYLVALLSSTGLLGLLLLGAFTLRLLTARVAELAPGDAVAVRALRLSYVPVLAIQVLIGTTPDFGVLNGLRWGVLLSLVAAPLPRYLHAPRVIALDQASPAPACPAFAPQDRDIDSTGPIMPPSPWHVLESGPNPWFPQLEKIR